MDIFGYSLWFLPPPHSVESYSEIIKKLATKYTAPVFQPHITLVGTIPLKKEEIIERMGHLTSRFAPFPLTMTEISYKDSYFESLYILVRPSEKLIEVNVTARTVMGMEKAPYMPHISLLYGSYPVSIKERIIADLGREQLNHFTVDSLHLIQSSGDESTWKSIQSFPLGGIS